jgi:cyclopropane fatty-acyl-phospholipid synthase-like methyltransferase
VKVKGAWKIKMIDTNKIIKDATDYYEWKLKEYGAIPQGVDWNSKDSQEFRFKHLLNLIKNNRDFTILDYGCGYGSLIDYMKNNYHNFGFTGFDSSNAMIEQAKKLHPDSKINWINNIDNLKKFDFVIASGVFNVKLDYSDEKWYQYVINTLEHLNKLSQKGFSFNVLTKYSDKEFMKDYLFYADPLVLFDHCKKTFSRHVALLHDYPLYEFTIIVRKGN